MHAIIRDRNDGMSFPIATVGDDITVGSVITEMSQPEYRAIFLSWEPDHEHVQMCATLYEPATEKAIGQPQYIQLDRAGINALINRLRIARDGAFGKDQ